MYLLTEGVMNMRWTRILTPLLVTGFVVSMGALGTSTAGAAEYSSKTVNVGVVEDLTGDASFCGVDELKGMKLAVNQAKSQGIHINLDVKDDASTASQGVVALHS